MPALFAVTLTRIVHCAGLAEFGAATSDPPETAMLVPSGTAVTEKPDATVDEAYWQSPEANAGDVVSDLNTKRARIHGITPDGGLSVVEAEVPLSEVQRYAADLRSLTQGRGLFELEFDHYGEVPGSIAQKVIAVGSI